MGVEHSSASPAAAVGAATASDVNGASWLGGLAEEPVTNNKNISRMDPYVQQRISKGVNYNLKVVIRGKRNVGKTMLFRRLQGFGFQKQVRCLDFHDV